MINRRNVAEGFGKDGEIAFLHFLEQHDVGVELGDFIKHGAIPAPAVLNVERNHFERPIRGRPHGRSWRRMQTISIGVQKKEKNTAKNQEEKEKE